MEKAQQKLDFFDGLKATDVMYRWLQTVEKPQFCVRQNWGFESILDKNRGNIRICKRMWVSSHFLIANFFKFMAANLSLTQFVTWARPVYLVYLMPCFSLASAKTRSMVSLRIL